MTLHRHGGCIRCQQIQFVRPELFDKVAEPGHACGVEPVVPVAPLFAGGYKPGLLQQEQVLGHCGAAHSELRGQLANRLFLARQELQETAPVRLRSNLQGIQHT